MDAAIENGGTYYLTYQLYPTPEQLHRAYPNAGRAFERKRHYDPDEIFSSQFYERYGHTQPPDGWPARSLAAILRLRPAARGAAVYLFLYEPPYQRHAGAGSPRGRSSSPIAASATTRRTTASMRSSARSRPGMDGVDVDGQFTRDGELVIFHDLSVDRLTSGTGRVRDKTLAEMLALDLGPKYDRPMRRRQRPHLRGLRPDGEGPRRSSWWS